MSRQNHIFITSLSSFDYVCIYMLVPLFSNFVFLSSYFLRNECFLQLFAELVFSPPPLEGLSSFKYSSKRNFTSSDMKSNCSSSFCSSSSSNLSLLLFQQTVLPIKTSTFDTFSLTHFIASPFFWPCFCRLGSFSRSWDLKVLHYALNTSYDILLLITYLLFINLPCLAKLPIAFISFFPIYDAVGVLVLWPERAEHAGRVS